MSQQLLNDSKAIWRKCATGDVEITCKSIFLGSKPVEFSVAQGCRNAGYIVARASHVVLWSIIFVGPQYGTCFNVTLLWLEF